MDFSKDDVLVALSLLDSNGISTEHLKHSSSAIAESLALLFTSILCHSYLPKCFRDCVLVPIQKQCCQVRGFIHKFVDFWSN